MIETLRQRILQVVGLVAGMLLWTTPFLTGAGAHITAEPRVVLAAEGEFPYHVIASGHGPVGTQASELVWLVRHGAVSGDKRAAVLAFPLGFVIAQRGTLDLFDRDGTRVEELDPGQATFLRPDGSGSLGSATGDLVLFVQIALVPAAGVPDNLPSEMHANGPFPGPPEDALDLELIRGILNPGHKAELSMTELPALLLAADSPLQIELPAGPVVDLSSDESVLLLLWDRVTIRNLGQQPATFVLARSARADLAPVLSVASSDSSTTALSALDPALDEAWHRNGCHLNPGNPSCLTVGVAAECAIDPASPACIADSDGDRCSDIAEVEAGFEPFDATDCVATATGQPAVNCLFTMENLACNGERIAALEETECAAERDIRLRRDPRNFAGCERIPDPPADACQLNARNPACDGFAPGGL